MLKDFPDLRVTLNHPKTSRYCCQDCKLGMDKLDQLIVLASVRAGTDTYTDKPLYFVLGVERR